MPRSRRSYAYLISCRLGDAMAAHVVMVWACAYATEMGGGRQMTRARMVRANQHQCNIADIADRLGDLYDEIDQGRGTTWDHFKQEMPEMYGLGCVVDHSRNSAFRRALGSRRITPDLVQVTNNDRLDDWSPNLLDTLPGRIYLINDLSLELGEQRVKISPEGDIPVQDIAEALGGVGRKSPLDGMDPRTIVVETDYRDDLALCTALGVFWSHYRAPSSENWDLFQGEGGNLLLPYSGAVI